MQESHYAPLQSPELLLEHLNAALRELRGAMAILNDPKLSDELAPVMRSLLLAEVVGNDSIIAIGGSQGAGKTSLLQAIYQLEGPDAEWLKPNRGQGERMPVLVTEEAGCERVQGAIRCLKEQNDGRYAVVVEPVSLEEFHQAVRNPEPSQLLPVLSVPPRYFNLPKQGWLLLPGYEKEERQNRQWQRLMRQALVGASGCIIVTDATRMANQQQLDIAKDMLSNELRGAQTLIVVSKTEALRDDQEGKQRLRQTAREVFSIPPERGDEWIICTGTSNEAYTREWLPAFADVARDLAWSGGSSRGQQLARLQEVLRGELTTALTPLRTAANIFFATKNEGENGANETVKRCLEAFDDQASSLRADYEDSIGKALDAHLAEARKGLTKRLIEDHEGIKNHLKDYLRTSSESVDRLEKNISDSWSKAGPLLATHATVISQLTTPKLQSRSTLGLEDQGKTQTGSQSIYKGASSATDLRPNEDDLQNYKVLFRGDSKLGFTNGLESSIELLPTLTLEYARIASLISSVVGVDEKTQDPVSVLERPALVGDALGNLKEGVSIGTAVLRGIATVLAVDVATDGDVDVLTVLGKIFGGGGGAAETAPNTGAGGPNAGPVVAASTAVSTLCATIIGAIAVGYLVHSAIQQVRQYDLKAAQAAHFALNGIRDRHFAHFMSHYDDMMAKMREHLKQALRKRYHLDQHLLDQDRLVKALADVRVLSRDLLQHLERSGQSLALFTPNA